MKHKTLNKLSTLMYCFSATVMHSFGLAKMFSGLCQPSRNLTVDCTSEVITLFFRLLFSAHTFGYFLYNFYPIQIFFS